MSRKKTTTIRVKLPTKRELLMQEVMRSCPALDGVPSHGVLAALAHTTGSGERSGIGARGHADVMPLALAQFEARREAVTANPSALIAARVADPNSWSAAEELYTESREALTMSPARASSLAARGDRALRAALASGARLLAAEERTLATTVMDDALRAIGCRTIVAEGDDAAGIWAERGHQLAAVLVRDGGNVELDVAGFEGDGCLPFHEEIERAVGDRGGTFEDVEVVQHGDSGGGVLIRGAAQAAGPGGDLARGIVAQSTRTTRSRFSGSRGDEQATTRRVGARAGS